MVSEGLWLSLRYSAYAGIHLRPIGKCFTIELGISMNLRESGVDGVRTRYTEVRMVT